MEMLTCQLALAAMTHPQQATLQQAGWQGTVPVSAVEQVAQI